MCFLIHKCLVCNGCLTPTWIAERKRVFWCFLCRKYYDIIGGKIAEIDREKVEKELLGER